MERPAGEESISTGAHGCVEMVVSTPVFLLLFLSIGSKGRRGKIG